MQGREERGRDGGGAYIAKNALGGESLHSGEPCTAGATNHQPSERKGRRHPTCIRCTPAITPRRPTGVWKSGAPELGKNEIDMLRLEIVLITHAAGLRDTPGQFEPIQKLLGKNLNALLLRRGTPTTLRSEARLGLAFAMTPEADKALAWEDARRFRNEVRKGKLDAQGQTAQEGLLMPPTRAGGVSGAEAPSHPEGPPNRQTPKATIPGAQVSWSPPVIMSVRDNIQGGRSAPSGELGGVSPLEASKALGVRPLRGPGATRRKQE